MGSQAGARFAEIEKRWRNEGPPGDHSSRPRIAPLFVRVEIHSLAFWACIGNPSASERGLREIGWIREVISFHAAQAQSGLGVS